MNPLVSIIIPNFNKAEFLEETLSSVLFQKFSNWECIIVDDGSTDDSIRILNEFQNRDQRFKVFSRPIDLPKGGNTCRNLGFKKSKGEFIQFLDSDDVLHEMKIFHQVKQLLSEDLLAISVSNFSYFSDDINTCSNKVIDWDELPNNGIDFLLNLWNIPFFVPPFCYLARRKLIELAGPWDARLIKFQDGEFFTRVFLKSSKVVYNTSVLGFYRIPSTGNNVSQIFTKEGYDSTYLAYCSYEKNILEIRDDLNIRFAISKNFSSLVLQTITDYPLISKKAFRHIKDNFKFRFFLDSRYSNSIKFSLVFGLKSLRLLNDIKRAF